ncbi:MAG: pectin acetylesterase-family hydrolase [Myxococcota bacterium]
MLGCSDDNPGQTADTLPGPPPAGEWIEILPGGDTICARGTEYRFFVRGGRTDRVIVDFQGGGACWNDVTCSFADALFSDSTGTLEEFTAFANSETAQAGIFTNDPSSPFADWTIVHIPYCTGDIHWGNSFQEYSTGLPIEHRGFVNAQAALDWVYSRYEMPERMFVTGCSAGAYGAALHSAYIANHYPNIDMAVLADSGAGIITDSFLNDSLPNWNAEAALPSFIPSVQVPIAQLSLTDLYIGLGETFPQHRFAQTGTAFDDDQIFFFSAMGGTAADWPMQYRSSLQTIDDRLENFTSYVPPGSMHCVTPYPFFFERNVNDVSLSAWSAELANGTLPAAVACEGAECCNDPVCDACAQNGDPRYCRFCRNWPPAWSECATTDGGGTSQ